MEKKYVRITYKNGKGERLTGDISETAALKIFEELLEEVKLASRERFGENQKSAESIAEETSETAEKIETVAEKSSEITALVTAETSRTTAPVTVELPNKTIEKVDSEVTETTETSDATEVSEPEIEGTNSAYKRILTFLKESKDCFRITDICSVLGTNKKTTSNYLNMMLKKGDIKHPEGKSTRWYCAVHTEEVETEKKFLTEETVVEEMVQLKETAEEETTLSEEVSVKEENIHSEGNQPEAEEIKENTQLERFLKNEADGEIISYILTRSKFNVENTRRKFKRYEESFCNIIRFLNEIGWIEFLEDERAYKVKGYAIIWYILKIADKPLTLDEIMEQREFTNKDKVGNVIKRAVEKDLVEKITEGGEVCYVAKIK